jgi:hypothetical protein
MLNRIVKKIIFNGEVQTLQKCTENILSGRKITKNLPLENENIFYTFFTSKCFQGLENGHLNSTQCRAPLNDFQIITQGEERPSARIWYSTEILANPKPKSPLCQRES